MKQEVAPIADWYRHGLGWVKNRQFSILKKNNKGTVSDPEGELMPFGDLAHHAISRSLAHSYSTLLLA